MTNNNFSVVGASEPGIPLVFIGRNHHIGWGLSISDIDTEDLFIEEFESNNSTSLRYKLRSGADEEWGIAVERQEEIVVLGQKDATIIKVKETVHGPIITHLLNDVRSLGKFQIHRKTLALCSNALKENNDLLFMLRLNRATTWETFLAASNALDSMTLNVIFTDVLGNIGSSTTGKK